MRVAIIAPPFIAIPPPRYGGTELFIAELATGLHELGHDVVVYANGESRLPCRVRSLYAKSDWPPCEPSSGTLKSLAHVGWAFRDLGSDVDAVHLNDALAAPFTPFVSVPAVMTLHHPHEGALSELYMRHPGITYVAISEHQRRREPMPRLRMVHHGIRVESYRFERQKQDYLAFIGRIAPIKGVHLAIEVARRTGIPLKIAGEIQPVFRPYWEREVAPHVDGSFIEYVGEADFAQKNDLLASARAMLFPVQWEEPFGLVMVEAMACGTPVLALPGGAVREVVKDGVSGYVCANVDELAHRATRLAIDPLSCRAHVAAHFHVDTMVRRYELLFRQLAEGPRSSRLPVHSRRGRDAGLAAAAG